MAVAAAAKLCVSIISNYSFRFHSPRTCHPPPPAAAAAEVVVAVAVVAAAAAVTEKVDLHSGLHDGLHGGLHDDSHVSVSRCLHLS